jgi:glycosyltransferase involved in cell wall biosynthesis
MLGISFLIFSIIYILLISYLILGLLRISKKDHIDSKSKKYISVIIAARNEENNILRLLQSLEDQTYPKEYFEVIIVDDRSYDNTNRLICDYMKSSKLDLKLFEIPEKGRRNGKKYAIAKGIDHASHDILLFTDSDCIANPKWIETFAKAYDDETDYVLAYTHVKFKKKTLLNRIKTFEGILYRVIAASGLGNGTPMTASASNMSYRKSSYLKAKGFGRYKNIKSGDDDLQLFNLWIHLRKKKYLFTPQASVITMEKESFSSHVNLDTRRASKFKYFPWALKLFSLLVFFYYIYFIVMVILLPFNMDLLPMFSMLLALRIGFELFMMTYFCIKINKKKYIIYYFIFTLVYVLIFIIFSLRGVIMKYKWKI